MPDSERQSPKEAALSGVLGGWSGATFVSTSLTIAEFSAMSRGNFLMGESAREPGAAAVYRGGVSGVDSAARQLFPAQSWSRARTAASCASQPWSTALIRLWIS